MGLWGTLAKIGGAVAAPFTGGASLAIPIAADVAGSVIKSRQVSKAAKAGQEATRQAGQHRGMGYELASRALSPWASAGQGALANLGSMVGAPSVPFPGLVGLPQGQGGPSLGQAARINPETGRAELFGGNPDLLYSRAATPNWQNQVRTAGGGPGVPGGPGAGRMVIVRAPTGETRRVPESEAAHYQQRGALVIRA